MGAMENFFGRLKVEMFYGEKFESVDAFIDELNEYIYYYNNERISSKLKGMSPVQYRIKIVGQYVDENSFWGAAVLLYIENNSDQNVRVNCDDVAINGYMVSALGSHKVYAGKKAISDITLLSSDLEKNGITSIDEVETEFRITNDDYKEIANSGKVKFSTK